MFQKKSLYYALPAIFLSTLLVTTIIWAWTEPSVAPPGDNVRAPVNVGGIAQIKSGPLQVNGFRNIGTTVLDGNVGIGDTTPTALLTVGSGDLFQVNSSGNLVRINNVSYSWPAVQGGANTFLRNDGTGNLTWVVAGGAGTVTSISAGAGLTASPNPITNTGTISLNTAAISTCTNGTTNKIYWDSTNNRLICGTDQTGSGGSGVTQLNQGTGIVLSPNPITGIGTISASIGTASINDGAVTSAKISWPLRSPIDGTVSEPAYSWSADTNMGIRRGGTDNLRFVTAGTDRVIIDSSGNVGIGTASPGAKLEVAGQIKITGGSPGANKVLTSDTNGLATWVTPTTGGSYTVPWTWMGVVNSPTRNTWTTTASRTIVAPVNGNLILTMTAGGGPGSTDDLWQWRLQANGATLVTGYTSDFYSTAVRIYPVTAGTSYTIRCQYYVGGSNTDSNDCGFYGLLF